MIMHLYSALWITDPSVRFKKTEKYLKATISYLLKYLKCTNIDIKIENLNKCTEIVYR